MLEQIQFWKRFKEKSASGKGQVLHAANRGQSGQTLGLHANAQMQSLQCNLPSAGLIIIIIMISFGDEEESNYDVTSWQW